MISRRVRYIAISVIGLATFFLVLGAVLFQAASTTGASANYDTQVSWFSALRAGAWPLSWRLLLSLLAAFFLAILASLMFFRVRRGIGAALLFAQAVVVGYFGGVLGFYFILREFALYHFRMDAEKLGEYWFVFEAMAIWMFAAAALSFLRIVSPKQAH